MILHLEKNVIDERVKNAAKDHPIDEKDITTLRKLCRKALSTVPGRMVEIHPEWLLQLLDSHEGKKVMSQGPKDYPGESVSETIAKLFQKEKPAILPRKDYNGGAGVVLLKCKEHGLRPQSPACPDCLEDIIADRDALREALKQVEPVITKMSGALVKVVQYGHDTNCDAVTKEDAECSCFLKDAKEGLEKPT